MPNGVHLGVDSPDRDGARLVMAHTLRGFTKRYGRGQRLFEPVPLPDVVPDALHQWRTSRYVPLNPCRKNYVRDPLEWLWSSYRDVMGAVAEPWVTAATLARLHGRPRQGFEAVFHGYVSADPDVSIDGTPVPEPVHSTALACFPLRRIQLAAGAAFRVRGSMVFGHRRARRLFVALARDQGWPNRPIAAASSMSERNVRRIVVASSALAAGRLCVADDRLLLAVDDLSGGFGPQRGRERAASLQTHTEVRDSDHRLRSAVAAS
jgi:hypothetical protein